MSADAQTLAAYADNVDDYLSLAHKSAPDADLQAFIAEIPNRGTVLDLGCGPGKSTAAMIAAGLAAVATDASPAMVATARNKFNINARLQSFSDLDDIQTYDGVFANFSLLHAPKSEFPDHLKSIHRAMKPGGLLHLGMKTGQGERRDNLGRQYAYYSESTLMDHLVSTGYNNPRTKRTGSAPGLAGDTEPFVIIWAYA